MSLSLNYLFHALLEPGGPEQEIRAQMADHFLTYL